MRNAAAGTALGAQITALCETALSRHAVRHAATPRRAVASYLRIALTCVRELARHARAQPALYTAAQALLDRIILAATEAEENCFATGGNSAPFISVLISAQVLRLRLQPPPAEGEEPLRERLTATSDARPRTAPQPAPVVLPRHFVPHNQGGAHSKNGHAPPR